MRSDQPAHLLAIQRHPPRARLAGAKQRPRHRQLFSKPHVGPLASQPCVRQPPRRPMPNLQTAQQHRRTAHAEHGRISRTRPHQQNTAASAEHGRIKRMAHDVDDACRSCLRKDRRATGQLVARTARLAGRPRRQFFASNGWKRGGKMHDPCAARWADRCPCNRRSGRGERLTAHPPRHRCSPPLAASAGSWSSGSAAPAAKCGSGSEPFRWPSRARVKPTVTAARAGAGNWQSAECPCWSCRGTCR